MSTSTSARASDGPQPSENAPYGCIHGGTNCLTYSRARGTRIAPGRNCSFTAAARRKNSSFAMPATLPLQPFPVTRLFAWYGKATILGTMENAAYSRASVGVGNAWYSRPE